MSPSTQDQTAWDAGADLEAAVNDAIAACGGDARAAVRALVVATRVYAADLQALRDEVAGISAAVSRGYARRRLRAPEGGEGR